MTTLNEYADRIEAWAKDKGWWDDNRTVGDHLMLMVSEIAEALEEFRDGHAPDEIYWVEKGQTFKPEGVPIELADVVIRLLHFAAFYNINMEEAMESKLDFNEKRPYRHGFKRL